VVVPFPSRHWAVAPRSALGRSGPQWCLGFADWGRAPARRLGLVQPTVVAPIGALFFAGRLPLFGIVVTCRHPPAAALPTGVERKAYSRCASACLLALTVSSLNLGVGARLLSRA